MTTIKVAVTAPQGATTTTTTTAIISTTTTATATTWTIFCPFKSCYFAAGPEAERGFGVWETPTPTPMPTPTPTTGGERKSRKIELFDFL